MMDVKLVDDLTMTADIMLGIYLVPGDLYLRRYQYRSALSRCEKPNHFLSASQIVE